MARLTRWTQPGALHHVSQGSVIRAFHDAQDYESYLLALSLSGHLHGVSVHGFVLLSQQVQLLVTPRSENALSLMMQDISRRFVSIFNRRHGRRGTLWQGRFKAAPVATSSHALLCLRYIEQLPSSTGWQTELADYPWSSAAHHLGWQRRTWLTDLDPQADFWRLGNTPFEREAAYRRLLQEPLTLEQCTLVKSTTLKGWALGFCPDDPLLSAHAERPLTPRRRGRPRKTLMTKPESQAE
jgi:putative transposase